MKDRASGPQMALSVAAVIGLAIAGFTIAPRAYEAGWMIAAQDDPSAIADRAVARSLNGDVANREIGAALTAGDPELAQSFVDLAAEKKVPVDPALKARVDEQNGTVASASRGVGQFAMGLVTGKSEDLPGIAGTAVGDLLVFGDIRDAVREGTRAATGQPVDELVLGLACVGLAVTAGTYGTLGAAAPVRVGLTVVKAARKAGRLGTRMTEAIGRSLARMVDGAALSRAIKGASVDQPITALRAARASVKLERGEDLLNLVGDVGKVQGKAGTRAALDGLKIAEEPKDMTRLARLAETKGSKTRAILKLAGRGALFLSLAAFNLSWWLIGALFTLWGLISAIKGTTEKITLRRLQRRKLRRLEARLHARMAEI